MQLSAGGRFHAYACLRISVILGLLAGFALSPKLWVSTRLFPLTPVWPFFRPLGHPGDSIVFAGLIALLLVLLMVPRGSLFAAAFALLLLEALQDQSRWQPWVYQYTMMLGAIAIAGEARQKGAMNTCRLVLAATYIWSGLAKLNPVFLNETFPWLVDPLLRAFPAAAQTFVHRLALLAPCAESAAGIALLTTRFRRVGAVTAIAMHLFILAAIGPFGLNFNFVVWPWNLTMIALLIILFLRPVEQPPWRDIVWGRGFAFQKVVLVFFALAPLLSLVNLWDDYLSSALYSGNTNSAVLTLSDAAFNRLPDALGDYVSVDGPNTNELDLDGWSLGEVHVPTYPETRIFKNLARRVCQFTGRDPSVKLVVEGKIAFANGSRKTEYRCPDLLPAR